MATIPTLCAERELVEVTVYLSRRDMPVRALYAFPHVIEWLKTMVPTLHAVLDDGKQSPSEQIDFLLYEFIRGADLSHYERAHIMEPGDVGVYEIKTADIRFFGWFPARDIFIVADIDTAVRCKEHNLYDGYRNQVRRRREALDLDEPKYVSGGINNVLSS